MRTTPSQPSRPFAQRGQPVVVLVNGRSTQAFDGETVAVVLLAEGIRAFRHTPMRGEPRGVFCGMGICHECLVTVDGRSGVRACTTPVAAGMSIETGLAARTHAGERTAADGTR